MKAFITTIVSVFAPFGIGACIAFILNVPLRAVEHKLNGMFGTEKKLRGISLFLVLFFIIGIFGCITLLLVPQITASLNILRENLPGFMVRVETFAHEVMNKYPVLAERYENINWTGAGEHLLSFLRSEADDIWSGITNAVEMVVRTCLGFVFAVYILLQKEQLARQIHMIFDSYLTREQKQNFMSVFRLTDNVFSGYLAGQCKESAVLGTLFACVMWVFHFPCPVLVGALISVTAFIPVVGSFIGCLIGMFLIAVTNPLSALWFLIIFIAIQQIESNFIYPKIVGKSVGLPPFWVLVAITAGGRMFGIAGIFMGVPVCAVLYALVRDNVNKRLKKY